MPSLSDNLLPSAINSQNGTVSLTGITPMGGRFMLYRSIEAPRSREDPQKHATAPRRWRYSSILIFSVATTGAIWLVFQYLVFDF